MMLQDHISHEVIGDEDVVYPDQGKEKYLIVEKSAGVEMRRGEGCHWL